MLAAYFSCKNLVKNRQHSQFSLYINLINQTKNALSFENTFLFTGCIFSAQSNFYILNPLRFT